jgi:hypothetical protein
VPGPGDRHGVRHEAQVLKGYRGCLVERNGGETAPLAVPGVGTIAGVPVDVKCGKGDRVRFKSGALEFNKVSASYVAHPA